MKQIVASYFLPFVFQVARLPLSRFVLSQLFSRWVWLLPMSRLYETESLLAFYHPRPSYAVHVLLVPKRPWVSLTDVPPHDPFWVDLLTAVQHLVQDLHLTSYRLINNNGPGAQDVPHLHFHLVSDVANN